MGCFSNRGTGCSLSWTARGTLNIALERLPLANTSASVIALRGTPFTRAVPPIPSIPTNSHSIAGVCTIVEVSCVSRWNTGISGISLTTLTFLVQHNTVLAGTTDTAYVPAVSPLPRIPL